MLANSHHSIPERGNIFLSLDNIGDTAFALFKGNFLGYDCDCSQANADTGQNKHVTKAIGGT